MLAGRRFQRSVLHEETRHEHGSLFSLACKLDEITPEVLDRHPYKHLIGVGGILGLILALRSNVFYSPVLKLGLLYWGCLYICAALLICVDAA